MTRFNAPPYSSFSRISGRNNTLVPFIFTSGMQESLTQNGNNVTNISIDCYHTKIYSTDYSIILQLLDGKQDGQLKKITFVFKGSSDSIITVECPTLIGIFTQIIFSNIGDQILLMWINGLWTVIESINTTDPSLQTPLIE